MPCAGIFPYLTLLFLRDCLLRRISRLLVEGIITHRLFR